MLNLPLKLGFENTYYPRLKKRKSRDLWQKLYEDYKAKDFEVLSVLMDGKEDFFMYDGQGYIAKDKLTFKMLFAELAEDEMFEMADSYGIAWTPTSMIVDKKGKVDFVKVGGVIDEEIKKVIEPLLSDKE